MRNLVRRLWEEEEGQDLVEYGLLVVLVSLTVVVTMRGVASAISKVFSNASSSMS
jgi:Flp pilus assembly pilin Flp